jgi:hypothetical protein
VWKEAIFIMLLLPLWTKTLSMVFPLARIAKDDFVISTTYHVVEMKLDTLKSKHPDMCGEIMIS